MKLCVPPKIKRKGEELENDPIKTGSYFTPSKSPVNVQFPSLSSASEHSYSAPIRDRIFKPHAVSRNSASCDNAQNDVRNRLLWPLLTLSIY